MQNMDLKTFSQISLKDLLYRVPKLEAQLMCVILYTILWFFLMPLISKFIQRYIDGKSWKQMWLKNNILTIRKMLFIECESNDEYYEISCNIFAVIFEHSISSMLCLPILFSFSFLTSIGITNQEH